LVLIAFLGCSSPEGSPYGGDCPLFQLLETTPFQGAVNVSPLTPVSFRFSDFPDPDTVFYPTVTVTSGFFRYTARSGVDLVRRSIQIVPNSALPMGVEVTALGTPDLHSLHGCRVFLPPGQDDTLAVLLQFRTSTSLSTPAPEAPPPTSGATVVNLFHRSCAGGCHLSDDPDAPCLLSPSGHLSLCANDAQSALVGMAARENSGVALVAPRDSARSYLMRKLLGAPPARAIRHPADDALSDDELSSLESWIEAGAASPGSGSPP
jgi:hypothetical protein